MSKLRVLDLFSGIGGFSLGLERTGGFETVAFCEIDPFCRKVLAKHWPEVPCYEDVRTLTADALCRAGIAVDVICGGFPCQDISFAGKRAGLKGARSGLWYEYSRLVCELQPWFVIVENVPGLLSLGMGTVLGDLAALRYDAVWDCIPAAAVGAPHRRDRIWIVAKPQHSDANDAGSHRAPLHICRSAELRDEQERQLGSLGEALAHPCSPRLSDDQGCGAPSRSDGNGAADSRRRLGRRNDYWLSEPDVGRVAHGVPSRVDRLRALGNAVVPQIPEMIGYAILSVQDH